MDDGIVETLQVYMEVDDILNGRKVRNAGWEGAWKILSGSAQAAATGCAVASGFSGAVGAGEGAAEVAETGANDIDGENAFNYVIDGHTEGGADAAGNSIFSGDAQDVANLIQNADTGSADVFEQPWNGNTVYVNYSENVVGYSATGQYTNVCSVVVNGANELVTAFPGFPN